jgi:hypothetical protein
MGLMKKLFGGSLADDFLGAVEVHSVAQMQAALDRGLDLQAPIQGKSPATWLTEMYSRSDRFPECLRWLLDRGAVLADPVVAPVLLNDAQALTAAVHADPRLINYRTTMTSAFTPLVGASLLHVAAEYGHLSVARVLVDHGADVNAKAAVDDHGLNGHTPIFHTVNSNDNRSAPIMRLLLDAGASSDVRLAGITWGKGFEWETTFFDVTPVSYAQFGLLPQVHRKERDIYDNVACLLQASGRTVPPLENIPNRYLTSSAR